MNPVYADDEESALRTICARLKTSRFDEMNGLKTYGNAVDD